VWQGGEVSFIKNARQMARRSIEDTRALTAAVAVILLRSKKSNHDLALELGVSEQYLNNYKYGRKEVTLSLLIKLRRHLKLDLNKLLDKTT